MRTVIFLLGLMFIVLLEKHWGLENPFGFSGQEPRALGIIAVFFFILDIAEILVKVNIILRKG